MNPIKEIKEQLVEVGLKATQQRMVILMAGGILSAAMDGQNVARAIAARVMG